MSSAETWCLDRYARFINKSPIDGGLWKPYGNEEEKLIMSLTQQHQLLITQGSTLLESHNLVRASTLMRGLSRTDSLLLLYKLENETRRFKVKFSSVNSKTGSEMCAEAIQVLSKFITIKTNINTKSPEDANQAENCMPEGVSTATIDNVKNDVCLQGEITLGTMAKALLDKNKLPLAYYQSQGDVELIPQLLLTCLADPSFPAFVQAVEDGLQSLVAKDSS